MPLERLISQVGPLLMLALGLAFVIGSFLTLDLGSARRLGPGAFPALVGGLLVLLALAELIRNVHSPRPWDRADFVSVLAVAGGVSAFALLTPIAGVLPATTVSVLATTSAVPKFRWPGRIVLALCVTGGVWLIFIAGLGIPLDAIKGL